MDAEHEDEEEEKELDWGASIQVVEGWLNGRKVLSFVRPLLCRRKHLRNTLKRF